jgi:hypothetical protein
MSWLGRIAILSCALLATLACVTPPMVVQGTVSAYDPQANTVTVRDELAPHTELVLSLAGTEIGSAPSIDDVVRVSYRTEGERLVAVRLMNLTRQEELREKKH